VPAPAPISKGADSRGAGRCIAGAADDPVGGGEDRTGCAHFREDGGADRSEGRRMKFELSYVDIGIFFFLTLGPLKAIQPFARATRGTEPAFRRTVAWRSAAIATAIVLGVALLGSFVLTNWHVSPPAITITCGIILFYQALRIVMRTPEAVPGSDAPQTTPAPPSLSIAVFPVAIPAIVTAPGIAAIAAVIVINRHDLAHEAVMVLNLLVLLNAETILRRGSAGAAPVISWVLAVLQASLAVQIVLHSLRVLEVLRWPS
jgi:multiple antibiotic resistance protein